MTVDVSLHSGNIDRGIVLREREEVFRQRAVVGENRAVADEGGRVDPKNARCVSALAMTLLRLGEDAKGLEALRRSWKLDPYDARTFNILELFEKIIPARYTTLATAHLRFRVEPSARPAIEAVVAPFLEETYARYVARYGFSPKGPVTFELYGDPRHFAVRTVGCNLTRFKDLSVCDSTIAIRFAAIPGATVIATAGAIVDPARWR